MKRFALLLFLIFNSCLGEDQLNLKPVTVAEFREFIEDSNYMTDAEKYGWSIVQTDAFNYKIVEGANWKKPDGINNSIDGLPVTQVSYNDAVAYSKWVGLSLPTYEQYWDIVDDDDRLIVSDNLYPILPVNDVNVVGNVWDITKPINSNKVRLAGGSIFCSIDTCHGTQKDRELFIDKETGNIHVGFSILTK
ncbi:MAG: SUMF1/EgtB/PvdO family nonheme iron enzyme [Bacteroidota bacterium]|nr:formylglycine-generating enzyme family protein [Flavobacteriaceae bacterium]MEC7186316.1 SUMF1/EgtB/PvdO family nonheme iron enzyme [Bacteroidota bacterium]MEC8612037.1 SUMF1/EgtB/PvdO family nonheme iron enzyme [Bacteroidota bacterium]|tara:strand:- start:36 stop:611 length:576 start_codon:yes stop_codon:yes gene_type:complete